MSIPGFDLYLKDYSYFSLSVKLNSSGSGQTKSIRNPAIFLRFLLNLESSVNKLKCTLGARSGRGGNEFGCFVRNVFFGKEEGELFF